jgi:hypothetical protein
MKLWFVACLTIAVVIIGVIVFRTSTASSDAKLAESAERYSEEVLPTILSSWDAEAMHSRFSAETRKAYPVERVRGMFENYNQELGTMTKLDEVNYQGTGSVKGQQDGFYIVRARATFQRGTRSMSLVIKHNAGDWRIEGFFLGQK